MIALTERTNVSRAPVEVSCTWPFCPPMEISTFLPWACLARIAAMKSASLSTFAHSLAGQRLKRMSPEVTEVGSPKARLMMSQAAGTSDIRMYPDPLAKLACWYPISACLGSPVLTHPVVVAEADPDLADSPAVLTAATVYVWLVQAPS